jgi:periplasmic divalent cation tolerance protein
MIIAWTTVARREEADSLAAGAVAAGLAVCVQVEGPVMSHFRWQGRLQHAEEYRLMLKCLPEQLPALEQHILAAHPYDTPEWIAVRAEQVAEKYLSWARANSTPLTL